MGQLVVPVSFKDHIRGSQERALTLVEYGDYEHPRCGHVQDSLKLIQTEFDDELCFIFRHFPLPQLHPNSLHAAFAAEAAAMQGKFWKMHDLLYENQEALEDEELIGYAAEAGVNLEQFIGDMASIDVRLKVRRDVESGVRSGVNTTPAFYINNQQLHFNGSAYDYPILRAALEDAAPDLILQDIAAVL